MYLQGWEISVADGLCPSYKALMGTYRPDGPKVVSWPFKRFMAGFPINLPVDLGLTTFQYLIYVQNNYQPWIHQTLTCSSLFHRPSPSLCPSPHSLCCRHLPSSLPVCPHVLALPPLVVEPCARRSAMRHRHLTQPPAGPRCAVPSWPPPSLAVTRAASHPLAPPPSLTAMASYAPYARCHPARAALGSPPRAATTSSSLSPPTLMQSKCAISNAKHQRSIPLYDCPLIFFTRNGDHRNGDFRL